MNALASAASLGGDLGLGSSTEVTVLVAHSAHGWLRASFARSLLFGGLGVFQAVTQPVALVVGDD